MNFKLIQQKITLPLIGTLISGVLVAIPALFVALRIGYYFRKHITPERFRLLVIFLMFLSAGSVIVSAFTN